MRLEVRASSIGMLKDVQGQASHTVLAALKVINWLFYESITRVEEELDTFVSGVRASVFLGPKGDSEGTVGFVGAPVTSDPISVSDEHVVVV